MAKYSKKKRCTHKKHHRKHRTRKNMKGGVGTSDMPTENLGTQAENLGTQAVNSQTPKKEGFFGNMSMPSMSSIFSGGRRRRRRKSSRSKK